VGNRRSQRKKVKKKVKKKMSSNPETDAQLAMLNEVLEQDDADTRAALLRTWINQFDSRTKLFSLLQKSAKELDNETPPLILAVIMLRFDVVKAFLELGADISVTDRNINAINALIVVKEEKMAKGEDYQQVDKMIEYVGIKWWTYAWLKQMRKLPQMLTYDATGNAVDMATDIERRNPKYGSANHLQQLDFDTMLLIARFALETHNFAASVKPSQEQRALWAYIEQNTPCELKN
jgi:hypothetical protein